VVRPLAAAGVQSSIQQQPHLTKGAVAANYPVRNVLKYAHRGGFLGFRPQNLTGWQRYDVL